MAASLLPDPASWDATEHLAGGGPPCVFEDVEKHLTCVYMSVAECERANLSQRCMSLCTGELDSVASSVVRTGDHRDWMARILGIIMRSRRDRERGVVERPWRAALGALLEPLPQPRQWRKFARFLQRLEALVGASTGRRRGWRQSPKA